MKIFRTTYKDSSVQVVTGDSIRRIHEHINWELVTSIEEIPDAEVSSTQLINSPFMFIKMANGALWLHNSTSRILNLVSDQEILVAVDNHITHLECHIDGLNRELENLKQKIYELVRDQPKSTSLQQLRELCGHVENGTDTKVTIFQDDATKSWYVRVGNVNNYAETLPLAVQKAYTKHPK